MQNEKKLSSLTETVRLFDREKIDSLLIHRLSTGIKSLDRALGGGISPGLYVLGAIPNLGKSTLALQIAQNISAGGTPVLFFSMEMPRERIASKALSRQIFINTRSPRYSSDMLLNENSAQDTDFWSQVDIARKQVAEDCKNLYVLERDETICSAEDIVRAVEDAKETLGQNNTPVVIVDYLQILSGDKAGSFLSDKAIVDFNIRILTTLSTQEKIPVILISSFNRYSYKKPVTMEGFKESGSIEYSADVILGMQLSAVNEQDFNIDKEKEKNPRDIELVVLKHRYGKSGNSLSFKYYPANDYFEEVDADKKNDNDLDNFFPELPERRLY